MKLVQQLLLVFSFMEKNNPFLWESVGFSQ